MVTSNTIIFVILIAKHSILTDFQMFREQIKNSVAYNKCILFIQKTKEDRSNEAAEESSSPVKKTFLRQGSGLVRFGGVGAPPRRMIRSRSQVLHRSRLVVFKIERALFLPILVPSLSTDPVP